GGQVAIHPSLAKEGSSGKRYQSQIPRVRISDFTMPLGCNRRAKPFGEGLGRHKTLMFSF
ncbi:MAG: hypothetical protein ACSHYA_19225, partial [Opitutaceae bacterium]